MSMYKLNKRPRDDISADPRKNLRKHPKKGNSVDKGSAEPQKTEETVRWRNLGRMRKSELLKICRKSMIKDSLPNDMYTAPKKMDIVDHIIDHEYHSKVMSFDDVVKRRETFIALDEIVLNEEDEYSSHCDFYLETVMDDQSLSIEPTKYESVLENHYRSLHDEDDNDTVLGDDESKSAICDEVSEEEVMSFERILGGKVWFTSSMNDVLNKVEPKKDITAHSFLKPPQIDDTISRSDITDQLVKMSYSEEEILKAYQEVVDQQDINAIVDQIEADRERLISMSIDGHTYSMLLPPQKKDYSL